jgi:hypothetical protein
VEVNNSSRAKVAEQTKRSFVRNANGCLRDSKGFFGEQVPSASEVSRLSFGRLRNCRVYAQEARNHFAHLLNRGSSLE